MVLYTSLLGLLAQLVEQLTLNQRVEGSSPSRPTNNPTPTLACGGFFVFFTWEHVPELSAGMVTLFGTIRNS